MSDTFDSAFADMRDNCPYCGSGDITSTYEDTDDNFTTYRVVCDSCDKDWCEQHVLKYRHSRPYGDDEVEFKWQ